MLTRVLLRQARRLLIVLLLGGLLGATLVRLGPGFGVDERELDTAPERPIAGRPSMPSTPPKITS